MNLDFLALIRLELKIDLCHLSLHMRKSEAGSWINNSVQLRWKNSLDGTDCMRQSRACCRVEGLKAKAALWDYFKPFVMLLWLWLLTSLLLVMFMIQEWKLILLIYSLTCDIMSLTMCQPEFRRIDQHKCWSFQMRVLWFYGDIMNSFIHRRQPKWVNC